jgi:hypothetical protein
VTVPTLQQTVDELYRVFARYPLREGVTFCEHCIDPDEVAALHEIPLREATPDQLGQLVGNNSTWGDPVYHWHFLPRLLELTANGAMGIRGDATFLPAFLTLWRDGTAEERRSLDRFFAAWWLATLTTWPARCEPVRILELIDGCEQRIAPYLAAWPTDSVAAAHHLADLVTDLAASTGYGPAFCHDINAWLCGPVPETMLTAAAQTGPVTGPALRALENLRFHRQVHCTNAT